jgi:hypothetical protein
MQPGERVLLQRQLPDGSWRTIVPLRAGGEAVLNALLPLRGAMTLRLLVGTLLSASESVPQSQSRL